MNTFRVHLSEISGHIIQKYAAALPRLQQYSCSQPRDQNIETQLNYKIGNNEYAITLLLNSSLEASEDILNDSQIELFSPKASDSKMRHAAKKIIEWVLTPFLLIEKHFHDYTILLLSKKIAQILMAPLCLIAKHFNRWLEIERKKQEKPLDDFLKDLTQSSLSLEDCTTEKTNQLYKQLMKISIKWPINNHQLKCKYALVEGLIRLRSNNLDLASQCFEKACELAPNVHLQCYAYAGLAAASRKQFSNKTKQLSIQTLQKLATSSEGKNLKDTFVEQVKQKTLKMIKQYAQQHDEQLMKDLNKDVTDILCFSGKFNKALMKAWCPELQIVHYQLAAHLCLINQNWSIDELDIESRFLSSQKYLKKAKDLAAQAEYRLKEHISQTIQKNIAAVELISKSLLKNL